MNRRYMHAEPRRRYEWRVVRDVAIACGVVLVVLAMTITGVGGQPA